MPGLIFLRAFAEQNRFDALRSKTPHHPWLPQQFHSSRSSTMNTHTAIAAVLALAGSASAANPLLIPGTLAPTDLIATGFDGPNTPAADTFYFDYYEISVDTTGTYELGIDALAPSLAPWVGIYANNFNISHYFDPAPIDLAADPTGGSNPMIPVFLTPGTYQLIASSVDWIQEPEALDEGDYLVTISGPDGANITLIPIPGTVGVLALATPLFRRRRRP